MLRDGELTVIGRIRSASNATFLCEAHLGDRQAHCVYKPIAGEAPLWDFPDGTLAGRELAAYLVSAALGWNIVPYTIIRDGPAGPGMLQRWVDQPGDAGRTTRPDDESPGPTWSTCCPRGTSRPGILPILQAYDYAGDEVTLVHADDARLRRMAVFDVLINNADRKGGHILTGVDGARVRRRPRCQPAHRGQAAHGAVGLGGQAGRRRHVGRRRGPARRAAAATSTEVLRPHITNREIDALYARAVGLLENPVMPAPDRRRPIPWPAF